MTDYKARNKALRICNERNLGAVANDTKWSEFFSEIQNQGISIAIKFIDSDKILDSGKIWIPVKSYIEGMHTGPKLFVFIEWIRSKNIIEISKIAKNVGLDYLAENSTVTVYGYK